MKKNRIGLSLLVDGQKCFRVEVSSSREDEDLLEHGGVGDTAQAIEQQNDDKTTHRFSVGHDESGLLQQNSPSDPSGSEHLIAWSGC